jgi:acetoin utilization deacetylase AcuC-like enzyme
MGVSMPSPDVVERVDAIRTWLIGAGHPEVTAGDPEPAALAAVHSASMIQHLRTIHDAWVVGGYATNPGQDRVVPTVFPTDGMLGGLPVRRPTAAHARAGQYCYDTLTVIGPGTWDAAEAAAGAALTAVDLVARTAWPRTAAGAGSAAPDQRHLSPMAYALCRPAGHHAGPEAYGGACYLNNAAIAAEAMRARGALRVAVIDLDAHHGNGTQAAFYDRGDVHVGSVHLDPAAGWFPHFTGHAAETGRGSGAGANQNIPVPSGAGDDRWLTSVERLMASAAGFGAEALVVSLGVDMAAEDPGTPLRVTRKGLREAGSLLGSLALPTVVVQEGGSHGAALGPLVGEALAGLAEGASRQAT